MCSISGCQAAEEKKHANALQVTLNVILLTNRFSLGSNDDKKSQRFIIKLNASTPEIKGHSN